MKLALHDIKRLETAVRQCPDGISFAQGALRAGGVPQEIKDAIKKILDTDKADHYGDVRGLKELRVALSDFINSQCGVIVPESSVLVTHGTTGAIANILHQLIEPGEEVLLPEPTYPAYWNMVLMARGVPVHTQVFEKENCGWKFSVDRLKESITEKTKAIALTNPSNPLGYCFSHDELCEVTELAEQRNLYVIVDEVYADHVFEGEFNSAVKFALKSRHVIKTGSFSKNFAMSGWRVGYLIADPLLVRDLWAVQDAQVCAPSLIAQFAALHAITHPELLVEMIEKVKKSRDLIVHELAPLAENGILEFSKPSAGFFLFCGTQYSDTVYLADDILSKTRVAVVPGRNFGPSHKSYIRLCYARPEKVVVEGARRLLSYFGV